MANKHTENIKLVSNETPNETTTAVAEAVEMAAATAGEEALSIPKPKKFDLNKFKSTRGNDMANVGALPGALPILRISDANDFVRLHPDEAFWSSELCFVNVPTKGVKQDTLHLIDEELAMLYLESKKILRFRVALATKPFDVFFLCQVPSQNLDNSWNQSSIEACEIAKTKWTQATSQKAEGKEHYKIKFARDHDAFPDPRWPKQSLDELLSNTFPSRIIEEDNHPALLRLIGAKLITS